MQIKRWSRAELWWEDPMCWKQKVVWIGQLQAGSANYKLLTLIFWLNLTKTSDQMDSTTARSDWLSPTLTLSFVSSQLLLKSWTGKCNTRRTRFNQAGSVSGLTRLTRVIFTNPLDPGSKCVGEPVWVGQTPIKSDRITNSLSVLVLSENVLNMEYEL